MTATFARTAGGYTRTAQSMATALSDFRIVTRIFGGLLGTDFIVSTSSATYRVGALTISQLERGIPPEELEMLECDPDTYEAI